MTISRSRAFALAASMLLLGAAASAFAPAPAEPWRAAVPEYGWSFPQDHWHHPRYKTEWWYFTGHLQVVDEPGRWFGYQFTFFHFGLLPEAASHDSNWNAQGLIMGHAAISDLASGRHLFSEVVYRAVPFLGGFGRYPERVIAWSRGPAGTDSTWTLAWNGEAFDFEMHDSAQSFGLSLSTRPRKDLVLQGPGGYSRKGRAPTQASQYYSFTRLATRGVVTLDDRRIEVSGTSWMDKEFGSNQLAENHVGWDWFSLQLDDGREVMLYALRDASGRFDFAGGTVVSPEGESRYLGTEDWRVEVLDHWQSPQTEARYPSGWKLQVAVFELELTVLPLLKAQENIGRSLYYWEGAVRIEDASGTAVGRGYVELTGYGSGNRPPM